MKSVNTFTDYLSFNVYWTRACLMRCQSNSQHRKKKKKTKQKNIKECELLIDPFPLWWHGICDSGQSQIANLAGFRIARMAKEKQLWTWLEVWKACGCEQHYPMSSGPLSRKEKESRGPAFMNLLSDWGGCSSPASRSRCHDALFPQPVTEIPLLP